MTTDMRAAAKFTPEVERAVAVSYFNDVWGLLDLAQRTPEQDDRMIHLAHASRLHWDNVGTDQHRAIGEWQCSRVYAVLGRGEPALFHANRALGYAGRAGVEDWVLASAHEGLARAHLAADDVEAAIESRATARQLAEAVADEDDKAVVLADIETLPLP
jgi:hypothetical protein